VMASVEVLEWLDTWGTPGEQRKETD